MSRIRPCENCKRRRRKCERASGDTTCARCSRLNLECIFDTRPIDNSRYNTSSSLDSTTASYSLAEVDGGDELEDLCQYVKTLEEELKQLQLNLDQQWQRNATQQQQQQQQSLVRATTSLMDTTLLPKEWNLTFVNGHLQLETGINTLSDLLRYRQLQIEQSKPIRYLSPLNGSLPLQFQLQGETMICRVVFLLTQHEVFSGSLDTLTDNSAYSIWNHRHQNRIEHAPISSQSTNFANLSPQSPFYTNETLLPSSSSTCCGSTSSSRLIGDMVSGTTSYCPELLVDSLVQQYFQCFNPVMPLIHRPTFMTHYFKQTSADPAPSGDIYMTPESQPFSSSRSASTSSFFSYASSSSSSSSSASNDYISQHGPVTLAICCFMCLTCCKHLPFTSHQKRKYGEYYYVACREQIDELYDHPSPHRQLEALMAINLLYKFMAMTLRLRDSRKLATIGFLLAVELSKYAEQPDSSFTEVEKELVVRHTILASITFSMVEFICVKRMDDIVPVKVQFKPLPGECDVAISMLDLYGRFCDLTLHHDSIVMVQQIRRVTIGQVGQVNLEALVRFEQTHLDWWKNLPQKWRYCEHPYDSTAMQAIELCDFDQAMMVHTFVLVLTLGVYSSLINPQNSQDQVSTMIQQRAWAVTLTCCELLMKLADRMKTVTQYCGFSCEYLLRVYDSLYSLLAHSKRTDDKANIPRLLNHISRLLSNMDGVIVTDNKVPPDMALASPEMSVSYSSSYIESTSNGLDGRINPAVYTRYPLPGLALLFDLVSSTAKDIGMTLS